MKNFLSKLFKGSADVEVDEIASLDSKASFGGDSTIRELIEVLQGLDIRELWRDGYSDKQIRNLMAGEYNLMELYKKEPQGNNKSVKGREILAKPKTSNS
jgi:hypothetical protein